MKNIIQLLITILLLTGLYACNQPAGQEDHEDHADHDETESTEGANGHGEDEAHNESGVSITMEHRDWLQQLN